MKNDLVALASKAAVTATHSVDIDNPDGAGVTVVLDVTSPGTGSVTVSINGLDPHTGKTWLLLPGAAVTTAVTNTYKVGRGLTAAANAVANDQVPRKLRFTFTHNNANPMDYKATAAFHG